MQNVRVIFLCVVFLLIFNFCDEDSPVENIDIDNLTDTTGFDSVSFTWEKLPLTITVGPGSGNCSYISSDTNNILYAFTDKGVFYSQDLGKFWNKYTHYTGRFVDNYGNIYFDNWDYKLLKGKIGENSWQILGDVPHRFNPLTISTNSKGDLFAITPIDFSTTSLLKIFELNQGKWNIIYTSDENFNYYVTSDDHIYLWTVNKLIRSTDKGITWVEISIPDMGFNQNLASTHFIQNNGKLFFISGGSIYISADGGNSWLNKSIGIEIIKDICFDKNGTAYLLARLAGQNNTQVLQSNDAFDSWNLIPINLSYPQVIHILNNRLFIGTSKNGLFYSDDNGNTWNSINTSNPDLSEGLFIASNGLIHLGEYYSADKGLSWIKTNFEYVESITGDNNKNLYANAGGEIFVSTDSGINWTEIPRGWSGWQASKIALRNNKELFVSVHHKGVFVFSEDNSSWSKVYDKDGWLWDFYIDKNEILYLGSQNGIFKSVSGHSEWKNIGLSDYSINSISVTPTGDIFAGTMSSGLFLLSNGGTVWEKLNTPFGETRINVIFIDSKGTVFIGADQLYFSSDNCKTWNKVDNFSNIFIQSISETPENEIIVKTKSNWVYRGTYYK